MPDWWDQPGPPLTEGAALVGLTAGSALFVGDDGAFAEDNDAYYYDAAHGVLNLGTRGPNTVFTAPALTIVDENGGVLWLEAGQQGHGLLQGFGHDGTIAAPTVSQSGNTTLGLEGYGATTAGAAWLASLIEFNVDLTPLPGDGVQGQLALYTTDSSGSLRQRLLLSSQGTTGVSAPDAGDAATQTVGTDNTNVGNTNTVTVNGTVYTFKTTLTGANGEVLIGASADASLLNLLHAINGTGGTAGTDYQVAAAHTTVTASTTITAHTAPLSARNAGTIGNSFTLAKSGAHLTVGGATFSGGREGTTVALAGQVEVQGSLLQSGTKLGLLGATAVIQQAHIADATGGIVTDAEARAAIALILNALEAYGLLATS